MERLQRSFLDTRNVLSATIDGAELDSEDRRYFVDKYFELIAMESDAHAHNQRFLRDQAIVKALLAAGTVAVSILAVGGRIVMQGVK